MNVALRSTDATNYSLMMISMTIWTTIFANINAQNKAVFFVKSSDTSRCGSEAHLRADTTNAVGDRNNAVINAVTKVPAERLIDIVLAAPMSTNFE
mgnify:CR=1 FL=1